ncbi:hypothetical protein M378DRAFT_17582 [Amanita muscaria Koide BX008]|uniref:Uncharacterized protein n=1 Tax=Amanita muscaria (strain Koide BX008) TaxID=946122 RepID=A0A0C2SPA5_AMAMK|nr:hypothetical protein M378DRAFT_17582 [Amanita muscaria Koide BX008]
MPQATQHWLPSQRVHVVYNAADEQLIPIQGNHSIATCPWRSEERNDIAFEHYDPSSPDLGFGFQSQFPFSGHEPPKAGNFPWPWFIPSNGAADLPTPWPITDSSPQSPASSSSLSAETGILSLVMVKVYCLRPAEQRAPRPGP